MSGERLQLKWGGEERKQFLLFLFFIFFVFFVLWRRSHELLLTTVAAAAAAAAAVSSRDGCRQVSFRFGKILKKQLRRGPRWKQKLGVLE